MDVLGQLHLVSVRNQPAVKRSGIKMAIKGEARGFATQEDCFREQRLLEMRQELALQAILEMVLWPPSSSGAGGAYGNAEGGQQGGSKANLYSSFWE